MSALTEILSHYPEAYTNQTVLSFPGKKQLNVRFIGRYYRFENFAAVLGEQQQNQLLNWLVPESTVAPDLTFYHEYDPQLTGDGFRLAVTADHKVRVTTQNLRGLRYAYQLLEQLISIRAGQITCPMVKVKNPHPLALRGVIEGFYGQPWTHQDRIDVLHYLGQQRLNTYMYAPKDDAYQRKDWRELYPEAQQANFRELLQVSQKEQIDFYYMISPGNDINLAEPADLAVLCHKLQQMIDLGFNRFGLLFDDIDYHLKGAAAVEFGSAAAAHANLANQVNRFLRSKLTRYQLVVCPTEYDNAQGSPYLHELTAAMDPEIAMFWTGPSTLAAQISQADLAQMAAVYQRPMIIWDNVPVNDYQRDAELLFLSPYENRTAQISNPHYQVVGVVANPMAEWEPSKLTVGTMANFLWQPAAYDDQRALHEQVAALVQPDLQAAFLTFIDFNRNRFTQETLLFEQKVWIAEEKQSEITTQLTRLVAAATTLQTGVANSPLLKQMAPWLARPAKDLALWQAYLAGNATQVASLQKELQAYPHRMVTDLVAAYLLAHPLTLD